MSAGAGRLGQHVPALDGVRGLAIGAILVFHATLFTTRMGGFEDRPWTRLLLSGWMGVDLFFVLSGYLITGILLDTRGAPGYFRSFYARRTLRVFPLYYAALVAVYALLPGAARPAGSPLWLFGYLTNVWIAWGGWQVMTPETSHFWSLAVEEQFYLVWPGVVLALGPRRLLTVCLAGVAAAPLLRAALLWQGADPVAVYVLTPTRFDTLLAGAALAAWVRRDPGTARLRTFARGATALGFAGALAVGAARGRFAELDPAVQIAGYSAVTLLSAGLLAALVDPGAGGPLVRAFAWRPARTLGRYSYGVYIVHPPVILATLALLGGPLRPLRDAAGELAVCAVIGSVASAASIAIAALSYHLYEQRFLAWKRRFPYPRASR